MKRKVYCCDGARDLYEEYYHRQNGGEIPVFVGRRFQHGHGLGSVLSGFFRRLVLPFFQSHGKKILAKCGEDDGTGGGRRVGRQNVERICQTSNSYGYKKSSSDSVHSRDLVFVE